MKMRRIGAVLTKQIKDTVKNKTILIQFILFPLMAVILTYSIAGSTPGIPRNYFVNLFSAMFVGMAPLVSAAAIIGEEKEKNTLRVLIMSNVKPLEYLCALAIYLLIACTVGALVFAVVGGVGGAAAWRFLLTMVLGIISSILVGAAVGVYAKNQMSATSLAVPLMMVFSFIPMISLFNDSVASFGKLLYTQQIYYLINNLSASNFTLDKFAIIGANIIIFAVFFSFAYKKRKLTD